MLSILPPAKRVAELTIDQQNIALGSAIDRRDIETLKRGLQHHESLAASRDPEHLGTLLLAERVLAESAYAKSAPIQQLREEVLIAVMLQSKKNDFVDLQMSVYSQFAVLLSEKGNNQVAQEFRGRALELQQEIFGTSAPFVEPPLKRFTSPSSITSRGGITLDFRSISATLWSCRLSAASVALTRGTNHRTDESWQAALGQFLTAYYTLESDTEFVTDAVLLRARAAAFVAESYVQCFEHDQAIPYAQHAVRIYQANPFYRAPHDYRFALHVLLDAYGVGAQYFSERARIQKLIDEFPGA